MGLLRRLVDSKVSSSSGIPGGTAASVGSQPALTASLRVFLAFSRALDRFIVCGFRIIKKTSWSRIVRPSVPRLVMLQRGVTFSTCALPAILQVYSFSCTCRVTLPNRVLACSGAFMPRFRPPLRLDTSHTGVFYGAPTFDPIIALPRC